MSYLIGTRNAIDLGISALTSGATVATNAANGNLFSLTLGINATLSNPTNMVTGAHYQWIIKQDATGSRTLAYGTNFKWAGGVAPSLSLAANAIDVLTGVWDGTNLYATLMTTFA